MALVRAWSPYRVRSRGYYRRLGARRRAPDLRLVAAVGAGIAAASAGTTAAVKPSVVPALIRTVTGGAPAVPPATVGTSAQRAFINTVAPGAVAGQSRYGVPAAVTIAQAINESNWGQSSLAAQQHNLFGVKGTGPAGSVALPTQEFMGGAWITVNAQFRAYTSAAQSIADHDALLATSGYYTAAMAARSNPDAFARALTGVYATNPNYGDDLITLMQRYALYPFDQQ